MKLNRYILLRHLDEGGKLLGLDYFDIVFLGLLFSLANRIARIPYDPILGSNIQLFLWAVIVVIGYFIRRISMKSMPGFLFHTMFYNQNIKDHDAFTFETMEEKVVELINRKT